MPPPLKEINYIVMLNMQIIKYVSTTVQKNGSDPTLGPETF